MQRQLFLWPLSLDRVSCNHLANARISETLRNQRIINQQHIITNSCTSSREMSHHNRTERKAVRRDTTKRRFSQLLCYKPFWLVATASKLRWTLVHGVLALACLALAEPKTARLYSLYSGLFRNWPHGWMLMAAKHTFTLCSTFSFRSDWPHGI